MKHAGKARSSAIKLLIITLIILLALIGLATMARFLSFLVTAMIGTFVLFWVIFAGFTLYFFRDPTATPPGSTEVIVSPAHGKVDAIDEIEEKDFMGGRCRRISVFLSVIDVHVQKAPITGKVVYLKHSPGKFINAMKADSAAANENVYLGFESAEKSGEKIGVRLIAGLLARRIIPWVATGEMAKRGERISLIQFGSRCDLYLPLETQIAVKLGQKVIGGETIMATRK